MDDVPDPLGGQRPCSRLHPSQGPVHPWVPTPGAGWVRLNTTELNGGVAVEKKSRLDGVWVFFWGEDYTPRRRRADPLHSPGPFLPAYLLMGERGVRLWVTVVQRGRAKQE